MNLKEMDHVRRELKRMSPPLLDRFQVVTNACHAGGRGFESRRSRHMLPKPPKNVLDFQAETAVARRSQSRRTDYDSLEKCNFVGFSACRCANVRPTEGLE